VPSVVAEANSQLSSQAAKPKSGQAGKSSGGDGFSGLVDENLAATDSEARSQAERPRPSAREGNAEPHVGVSRRSQNQAESAGRPDPSANSAPAENTASEQPAATSETNAITTGIATPNVTTEEVESAPDAEADGAQSSTAPAVPVQTELAAETPPEQAIEPGDAVIISNPPATIAATPAETAANALARVANDTADKQTANGTGTQTETTVETPPAAAGAAPTEADAGPSGTGTQIQAEVQVEAALPDVQLDAMADSELSAAAKLADLPEPTEEAPQVPQAASSDIKTAEAPRDVRVAPEQPSAKPDPGADRRADIKAAAEPRPDKPAHEPSAANASHLPAGPSENAQPGGFGATQVAPLHVPSFAAPAAHFTAVATGNVGVPLSGLAVEIAANVQIGRSRFEIRLDPPELGRIDVRLDVDRQGQVTSHLIVEKSATLDLLRRDAQQLERALQDAGLKTSDNGLQFSLRDQQQQPGRNDDNGPERNAHRLIVTEEETIAAETAGRSYGRMIGQRGGIDIRV
jgi:flagellar hook-length control protein FliK